MQRYDEVTCDGMSACTGVAATDRGEKLNVILVKKHVLTQYYIKKHNIFSYCIQFFQGTSGFRWDASKKEFSYES